MDSNKKSLKERLSVERRVEVLEMICFEEELRLEEQIAESAANDKRADRSMSRRIIQDA